MDFRATIGRYRILGKLGEGGMGVVYEAEQQSPQRRVAVKVVRGGRFLDDARVKMFQREADTLARLEHPNIGTIYESGYTDDGQHYFAMELVRGDTLDVYLEKRPKSVTNDELRFRLALFRQIAETVHYAHQCGVVHRDLKPSNIIVTGEAGIANNPSGSSGISPGSRLPKIKILDFGLAKITEGDVAAVTMVTEIGQIKGTLPYMSPEQARGKSEQIDVRTDVYALGVMLYEMLAGRRPYDIGKMSLVEAVRVICEEPALPLRQTMSGLRHIDLDVETIVDKALEKEVDRRYASAAAFSEDITRYLTSQPIQARPPSTFYQLRKFAARNRALVGGVVATLLVLTAGIVVSTIFGLRAESRRKEAEWRSYLGNIAAAEAGLRLGGTAAVKRRLLACPADLRGVEWSFLLTQLETGAKVLAGHEGTVSAIMFSPDGTRLASTSADKTVRLWDVATESLVATLNGHEGWVHAVAFNPQGTRLASGSADKTIRLWDTATGNLLTTLTGHDDWVYAVVFSPDGTRLASASKDKTARLWDARSGKLLSTLAGHDANPTVAFSREGKHLVSGSWDGMRLWDAVSGKMLATLTGRAALSLAFSADGEHFVMGSSDNMVRLWDARTWKLLATFRGHESGVLSVRFSPDGTRIASASADMTIRLWDVASHRLLATFRGHEGVVNDVAFSPDGNRLVSTSEDKSVRLWDAASGELLARLAGYEISSNSSAFSPDGIRLAFGSGDRVLLWDAAPGDLADTLVGHAAGPVFSVALSSDGTHIASGSYDTTVRLWDAASGESLATSHGHEGYVTSVAFSPDGTRLASASQDKTVRLWDAASGEHLATLLAHESGVSSVAFSPDGTRLASGSWDETVRLWDAASGQLLATMAGHEGEVNSVTFSPDGSKVASAAYDDTVRLWDSESGKLLRTLAGHEGAVNSVAFSPDGLRVASAADDETVRLWDLESGKLLTTLVGHEGEVNSIAFSPDGTRLASGSADTTVRLWDTSSGDLLATMAGNDGPVWSVAFSPDGSRLVSGGQGSIRLWETQPPSDLRRRSAIARGYEQRAQDAAAEPFRRAVVDGLRRSGASLSDFREALLLLGANLNRQRKYARAEPFPRESLSTPRDLRGEDDTGAIH